MTMTTIRKCSALISCLWLATAAQVAVDAADRPASAILEEIKGVEMPRIAAEDRADESKARDYQVVARSRDERLVGEAAFRIMMIELWKPSPGGPNESLVRAYEAFARRFPGDQRGTMVLAAIVGRTTVDADKETLNRRIVAD